MLNPSQTCYQKNLFTFLITEFYHLAALCFVHYTLQFINLCQVDEHMVDIFLNFLKECIKVQSSTMTCQKLYRNMKSQTTIAVAAPICLYSFSIQSCVVFNNGTGILLVVILYAKQIWVNKTNVFINHFKMEMSSFHDNDLVSNET